MNNNVRHYKQHKMNKTFQKDMNYTKITKKIHKEVFVKS